MRIKNSVPRRKWKKKVLDEAKGFRGRKKNCYALAIDMVTRKFKYKYRDRRNKRRNMRSLWITRINAAVRELGYSYSQFINLIKPLSLNRKMLSELSVQNKLTPAMIEILKSNKNEENKEFIDHKIEKKNNKRSNVDIANSI